MPHPALRLIVPLLLASASLACAATTTKPPAAKPAAPAAPVYKMEVEPRAMDLLKAMSTRLAAAQSLSFTAVVGYEFPSRLGPPIVYTTRYDVAMQRPDRLLVLTLGDGPVSEFYYDGKQMIAFAPAEGLAAVADAPPTVEAMLRAAYQNAAIFFPFTDLLVADPYAVFAKEAKLAFVVGPSGVVGGTKTDMVVWANNDVFLQIWIGTEDKLPRRVRAIFRDDPMRLRHDMELTNWQLGQPLAPEKFTSAKALAAPRIGFAAPKLPPGMKPQLFKNGKPVAAPKPAATAKPAQPTQSK
ncbi:MAG: hypothetical protein RL669_1217 [Pseudomonadota bacterium]